MNRDACYLSTIYITANLELFTPRFSQRATASFRISSKTLDILNIASHRVYLVSLQPNCTCFLLHLSSSHDGRSLTFMLLCDVRTFLPQFLGINKPFFLWSAKIRKLLDVKGKMLDDGQLL